LTTAGLFLGGVAVAGAWQSPPKPSANDNCLACHADLATLTEFPHPDRNLRHDIEPELDTCSQHPD